MVANTRDCPPQSKLQLYGKGQGNITSTQFFAICTDQDETTDYVRGEPLITRAPLVANSTQDAKSICNSWWCVIGIVASAAIIIVLLGIIAKKSWCHITSRRRHSEGQILPRNDWTQESFSHDFHTPVDDGSRSFVVKNELSPLKNRLRDDVEIEGYPEVEGRTTQCSVLRTESSGLVCQLPDSKESRKYLLEKEKKNLKKVSSIALRQVLINWEKIEICGTIGYGAFGEIFLGEYYHTKVAIKRCLPYGLDDNALAHFVEELTLMAKLRHPNIVLFMGAAWHPNYGICGISEYAANGSLRSWLEASKLQSLPMWGPKKAQMAYDIIAGLSHLHSQKPLLMHRDLKSGNILIGEDLVCKITDFGLCTALLDSQSMTVAGSFLWIAPEVSRGEYYSEKADIFSYAIVLIELLTHQLPYANETSLNGMTIAYRVAFEQYRPRIPKKCPKIIQELIESCWDNDPTKRPRALDIAEIINQSRSELCLEDSEILFVQ